MIIFINKNCCKLFDEIVQIQCEKLKYFETFFTIKEKIGNNNKQGMRI